MHESGLWLAEAPLVLASGSRTRADLLLSAGLHVEVIRPDVDERRLEAEVSGLNPVDLAGHLARAKAEDVAKGLPDRVVIGADQVLELNGEVLHKPKDLYAARDHLKQLRGRTHYLHSAGAIVAKSQTQWFYETAGLTMRDLGDEAIDAYLGLTGEARVTSSVGGYQLEGYGIHLFERIEGDHSTVLGLPLLPLLGKLRNMGLLVIA